MSGNDYYNKVAAVTSLNGRHYESLINVLFGVSNIDKADNLIQRTSRLV